MASKTSTASGPNTRLIGLAAGAVVVLLVVGITMLTVSEQEDRDAARAERSTPIEEVAGSPNVDGDALEAVQQPNPEDDPAVGAPSPVITGADFDGSPTVIGGTGSPQLVVFMASWCRFCQEELPEIATWINAGGPPDDVEVVAVSTFHRPADANWPPDAWFTRVGYPGAVLTDDVNSSVAQAFGVTGTPYWVAIDGDGVVRVRASGRQSMDVVEQLAQVVSGT